MKCVVAVMAVCLVSAGGGWCIGRCIKRWLAWDVEGEWVHVLMETRWYLPRCCGCGPKEPVCSLVHCV